jgi:hypothetical protein
MGDQTVFGDLTARLMDGTEFGTFDSDKSGGEGRLRSIRPHLSAKWRLPDVHFRRDLNATTIF